MCEDLKSFTKKHNLSMLRYLGPFVFMVILCVACCYIKCESSLWGMNSGLKGTRGRHTFIT